MGKLAVHGQDIIPRETDVRMRVICRGATIAETCSTLCLKKTCMHIAFLELHAVAIMESVQTNRCA